MKVSFCHYGNENMASYRYRCATPAKELGAEINNPKANVLIFAKPIDQDVPYVLNAKQHGRRVIADFCDMHFHLPFYDLILKTADAVTVPTKWFAEQVRMQFGIEAYVIPDPYEYPEEEPHCNGDNLLWFGQAMNIDGLERISSLISGYPLRIVSNLEGAIPWSKENMLREFAHADIVVMPETAPYKSANRTIESIRQGCFVVAEPHPAINEFPGIWIGNIKEGIQWAKHNPQEAKQRTKLSQAYVRKWFSPQTQADAWRKVIQKVQSSSISEVAICTGTDG